MKNAVRDVPARPRGSRTRRTLGALTVLLLLLLPVLGGLAGYGVALVTPPTYEADAYVLITSTEVGGDVTPGDIAQAVARVATSESVLVSGNSDRLLAAARADQLTASASPDAPLIQLTATGGSPSQASTLANGLARAVQIHMETNAQAGQVDAGIFASASAPSSPSSPNVLVDILAGVALGLLLASVGFALRRR